MRTNPYLVQMGSKIKAIRTAKGISIRKLGKMCEVDYSCLSRIENGQYSSRILTLKTIAEKLEVDIKDFF